MKISVCHYCYHRTWDAEKWTCERLAEEVKGLGVDAVDFHVRYLGDPKGAAATITAALGKTGLALSGLSMSNNFNQDDPAALGEQVDAVKRWLAVAAEVKAPVSRIFGGHIQDRSDPKALETGLARITDGLQQVVGEAEKLGVVLALENHGGLPCTGEEQVKVIESFNSPKLRATVDVGNYMSCGQEGHVGTALAAHLAAYVHFKDNKKGPAATSGMPWSSKSCTVGEGDVDLPACLEALKKAGYEGYVALEYEGPEDERTGVRKSVEYMKKVMQGY